MRVAKNEARPHPLERADPVHPAGEHPLVDEHGPLGLRRERDGAAREIGRKAWPDARLDRRDRAAEILLDDVAVLCFDDDVLADDLRIDTQATEHHARHPQVLRHGVLDRGFAVRHRDRADERAHLHVVAEDGVVDPLQALDAGDRERVRPDAVDTGSHIHESTRQLLDVRLAGRVVEHRRAGGEHRGEERVLGGRDRRLVEDHVRSSKS